MGKVATNLISQFHKSILDINFEFFFAEIAAVERTKGGGWQVVGELRSIKILFRLLVCPFATSSFILLRTLRNVINNNSIIIIISPSLI